MSDPNRLSVTGSNRGIGYTLAATIAARPNTIVFAGARDPAAQSLKDLAAKHPNVHPIKVTSGDELTTRRRSLRSRRSRPPRCGHCKRRPSINSSSRPPPGAPKLAYISFRPRRITLVKALDVENPSLIALMIHPGWVATDMGNGGAVASGLRARQ
ncbi:hypothetical protein B0H14DRAFT_3146334 [Mycena olivaceomarginata]|nr:hypothetical protein B0H14DRAFT_3146334 [Mycena olivaceomarginata]